MESFEALIPKSKRTKAESASAEGADIEELSPQEKEELINQLDEQLSLVTVARRILETELAEAKKTSDFSRFNDKKKEVQSEIAKAENIRRKMEGKSVSPDLSAEYKYKDKKGKEVGETINLNFETEIANWTDFYTKHGLTLPANFAEKMRDIWERNISAMEKEISEKGFNKVIFIPASVDSADLKGLVDSMTADYKEETKKAGKSEYDTFIGFDLKKVVNSRSGDRIILLHSAPDLTAQPELLKTLDKKYGGEKTNGVDNKAEDFVKAGEELTLAEWLILQREIWEKTGIHIDGKVGEDGYIKVPWLSGSRIGKGADSSVVCAFFYPDGGRVRVDAYSPGNSHPDCGCRLSRCFE